VTCHRREKDPADPGRLLAVPLPRKWIEAETLLNVLYDWPADPRFSRFLAQFVLPNAVYSRIGENRANQVPASTIASFGGWFNR
jgi:hypothetical protein